MKGKTNGDNLFPTIEKLGNFRWNENQLSPLTLAKITCGGERSRVYKRPSEGVTLTAGGNFLGITGHGDPHLNRLGTAYIVFWFLQVKEQEIICTHDNTSFTVNKISLAAYGSQDVQ